MEDGRSVRIGEYGLTERGSSRSTLSEVGGESIDSATGITDYRRIPGAADTIVGSRGKDGDCFPDTCRNQRIKNRNDRLIDLNGQGDA